MAAKRRRKANASSSKVLAGLLGGLILVPIVAPFYIISKSAKLAGSALKRRSTSTDKRSSTSRYYQGQIRKTRSRNEDNIPIFANIKRRYIFDYYPRHRTESVEFIAFDVETTGLDYFKDGIVEISFAHYCDGRIVDKYSTSINPGVRITDSASKVNGYTNATIAKAPLPPQVVESIYNYINYCIENRIPLVAHNAEFDLNFTLRLLERFYNFGDAEIIYCDTYMESFDIEALESRRLCDVAEFFHISNPNAHSSYGDACTTAKIFLELVNNPLNDTRDRLIEDSNRIGRHFDSKTQLRPSELEICRYIKNLLKEKYPNINLFAYKTEYGLIRMNYIYNFLIFSVSQKEKSKWILIDEDYAKANNIPYKKTASKHEYNMARYSFELVSDLDKIMPYIMHSFSSVKDKAEKYAASNEFHHQLCAQAVRRSLKI